MITTLTCIGAVCGASLGLFIADNDKQKQWLKGYGSAFLLILILTVIGG